MTTRREKRQEEELLSLKAENKRLTEKVKMANHALHNTLVSNQAAWIEWQHGRGAERAMAWVHNQLAPAGIIPDENSDNGKDPQGWYDECIIH